MTDQMTYDVAIVGYGPVGVTAANLLGQMGLNVVVVERDPDIYARARAISTDEEVVRIWQQVGLADRLNADMQPGCGANFVDANGRAVREAAAGHPGVTGTRRSSSSTSLRWRRCCAPGSTGSPTCRSCSSTSACASSSAPTHVELMLADLTVDEFRRIRASYVIAADGGSSAIRGQLGIGFGGRTYGERWIVIDTKVLKEWPGHDRLRFHCNPDRPTVDCPTPLGHHRWEFPVRDDEDEKDLLTEDAIWKVLRGQGITRGQREDPRLRLLQPPRPVRRPVAGGPGLPGRRRRPRDAAVDRPGHVRRRARRGQPVLEARRGAVRIAARIRARHLPGRAATARERGDQPRGQDRQADHPAQPAGARRHATTSSAPPARCPTSLTWLRDHRWIPDARYRDGLVANNGNGAVGWLIPQPWVIDEKGDSVRLDDVVGGRWTVLHTGPASDFWAWRTRWRPHPESHAAA